MPEPSPISARERRRARDHTTAIAVVLALVVTLGIFAVPKSGLKKKNDRTPPKPARTVPTTSDRSTLEREIWVRAGSLGASRPRTFEDVVGELAEFGPSIAPVALAVLIGEVKPPVLDRNRPALAVSTREIEDVLLATLERLPPERVLPAIEDAEHAGRLRGHELIALRAVADLRHPRALPLWIDIASDVPAATLADERFQAAAARSFNRLFDGLVGSRATFPTERVEGAALTLVARALAQRDDGAALGPALALLGKSPATDAWLLRALASIARHTQLAVVGEHAEKLRRYAREADTVARADALIALGGLADPEAVPLLLEALDDEEELVRVSARGALQRLSGVELGDELASWTAWYERESAWADTRRGLVLRVLDSEDPATVKTALTELAEHPFLRHASASTVAEFVDDPRAPVALVACETAGKLRSLVAAPALLRALADGDDARRDAAWLALRDITGRSLPRTAQTWRDVLAID
jgi:HEAT repeat protein